MEVSGVSQALLSWRLEEERGVMLWSLSTRGQTPKSYGSRFILYHVSGLLTSMFSPHLTLLSLSLLCALSCERPAQPTRSPARRSCALKVRVQLVGQPQEAGVIGAFNGYNPQLAPLSLLDPARGEWGVDVLLPPGEHLYALSVDGQVINDPSAKLTDVGISGPWRGVERSLARVSDCSRGRWYRVAEYDELPSSDSITLAFERATLEEGEGYAQALPDGAPLDLSSAQLTLHPGGPLSDVEPQALDFTWRSDAPEALSFSVESLPPGKHWVSVSARDQRGVLAERFMAPLWVEPEPFKWSDGLMYQVVLDRLDPPHPPDGEASPSVASRWGGGLESTLNLLKGGYFERFGVRSLWLSPVYPNPDGLWRGVEGGEPRYEGYHGYWPTSPRAVGEEWGGEALLDELVSEAHSRGIRVILDVVLNHVHEAHPYVSAHPEWFSPEGCLCGRGSCDWGRYIETCQFTDYLPDVRWGPDALRAQVYDALWWLERFDLDGLRVDAVPMMPRRVTRLLSALVHERLEGLRVRHLLLGETFTGPREWPRLAWYLGPWGLDGQFDFSLMWALRDAVAWRSGPLTQVVEAWERAQATWGDSASVMGLFAGNHDVTRFLSEAAGQLPADPWVNPPAQPSEEEPYLRLALAYALTLTLPGLPVLYYGDEVGMAGANDPDNRRPFWPNSAHSLSELNPAQRTLNLKLRRLAQLRSCLPGLKSDLLTWRLESAERVAFSRGRGEEEVIVLIERAPQAPLSPTTLLSPTYPTEGWRAVLANDWGSGEGAWPLQTLSLNDPLPVSSWSLSLLTRSPNLDVCLSDPR